MQMYLPRAAAIADLGWASAEQHDWQRFAKRLLPMLHRYDLLRTPYNAVPFQPQASVAHDLTSSKVAVTLSTQVKLGEIHYTLDGSVPSVKSPQYTAPLSVPRGQTIRAVMIVNDKPLTAPVTRKIDELRLQSRRSQELKLCSNGFILSQQDDAGRDGNPRSEDRAIMIADVGKACWIFEAADLSHATTLEADVGNRPFNLQLGDGLAKMKFLPPRTPEGELEARLDSCEGPVIASLPLAPAVRNNGITKLRSSLPAQSGRHDVCFMFTSRGLSPDSDNPLWLIDRIRIAPAGTMKK
jgi:hexosaminidase